MNIEEYYKAPSDEIFNEIKRGAIEIWKTYDDKFGYATNKINHIKDIKNVQDNTCYIVAMFDHINQKKLLNIVEGEAKLWLMDLMFNNQT